MKKPLNIRTYEKKDKIFGWSNESNKLLNQLLNELINVMNAK